jgi:hypothetical protein
MGMPGCDNALCYILDNAGYEVLNPSLDIKVIHLHLSLKRNSFISSFALPDRMIVLSSEKTIVAEEA